MNVKDLNFTDELNKTITQTLLKSFGLDSILHHIQDFGKVNFSQKPQCTQYQKSGSIINDISDLLVNLNDLGLVNVGDSTHQFINNIKGHATIEEFSNRIVPEELQLLVAKVNQEKIAFDKMLEDTPMARHKKSQKAQEICEDEEKITALRQIEANKNAIIATNKNAKADFYETDVYKYYQESTFLQSLGKQSVFDSVKLGLKESIGLLFVEIWSELRGNLPSMMNRYSNDFNISYFWDDVKTTFNNIFNKIKIRFKNLIEDFQKGGMELIIDNLAKSLINIFSKTSKVIANLFKELYKTLTDVARLIFFNPDKLPAGQLVKAAIQLLGAGIAAVVGSSINLELNTLMTAIPFGTKIAGFLSTFVTSLIAFGVTYFVETSSLMNKIFQFLDSLFKNDVDYLLEQVNEMNEKLDAFLIELGRVEFNFNTAELKELTDNLIATNDEYQRSLLLSAEMKKRNLELPFEENNIDSINDWLASL